MGSLRHHSQAVSPRFPLRCHTKGNAEQWQCGKLSQLPRHGAGGVGEGTVDLSWWTNALDSYMAFQNQVSDLSPSTGTICLRTAQSKRTVCEDGNVHCPVQYGVASHKWLLSTWNVTSVTEGLHVNFHVAHCYHIRQRCSRKAELCWARLAPVIWVRSMQLPENQPRASWFIFWGLRLGRSLIAKTRGNRWQLLLIPQSKIWSIDSEILLELRAGLLGWFKNTLLSSQRC